MNTETTDWIALIAKYGLDFAVELTQLIEQKGDPTSADFIALKQKYGTKTADQYLTESGGAPNVIPPGGTLLKENP